MIIILFIFLLLFIPIPLKITIHYSKESYYLKFYKVILFSNEGGLLNSLVKKNESKKTKANNKKTEKQKKKPKSKTSKGRSLSIKKLLYNIKNNPFKPKIKFDLKANYSLEDAAISAICFGLINNLNPILYMLFDIFFKIKSFKININPLFLNKTSVNFSISSIISINLAKIIYMLFLILKCYVKK